MGAKVNATLKTLEERQSEIDIQRKALIKAAEDAGIKIGDYAIRTIIYHLDLDGFEITRR